METRNYRLYINTTVGSVYYRDYVSVTEEEIQFAIDYLMKVGYDCSISKTRLRVNTVKYHTLSDKEPTDFEL